MMIHHKNQTFLLFLMQTHGSPAVVLAMEVEERSSDKARLGIQGQGVPVRHQEVPSRADIGIFT